MLYARATYVTSVSSAPKELHISSSLCELSSPSLRACREEGDGDKRRMGLRYEKSREGEWSKSANNSISIIIMMSIIIITTLHKSYAFLISST